MTWYFAGVLSLITTVLVFIGTNVIANDRMRESEDKRIQSECKTASESMKKSIDMKLDKLIESMSILNGRLSRIEGKLERND
jgi:hypothetical protein